MARTDPDYYDGPVYDLTTEEVRELQHHATRNLLATRGAGKSQKSWADVQGIPCGVIGQTHDGILISEANRATVYERTKQGIVELRQYIQANYRSRGVHAVLFGVETENGTDYAVFTESGWMREVNGVKEEVI